MTLEAARLAGDRRIARAFETTRPPYATVRQMLAMQARAGVYAPPAERTYLKRSLPTALFAPGYRLADLYSSVRGGLFSTRRLFQDLGSFDARVTGPMFELPIFLVQGDLDHVTPTPCVRDYFDDISEPRKDLAVLRGGGHDVVLTDPDRFLAVLLERVLPVVIGP